jgi:hypothetical protein
VAARFDEIVEFSGLDFAMDRQVKFYSSGMKTRLGFAVAAFLEPDILLVDEVLAVGDAAFQQRCLDRMRKVLDLGTTLLYVSHDLPTVEAMCRRAIWLDRGVVRADGGTREVLAGYRTAIEEAAAEALATGAASGFDLVRVVDDDGLPAALVASGAPVTVEVSVRLQSAFRGRVHVGLSEGPATPILSASLDCALEAGRSEVTCRFDSLPLARGRYYLWAGLFGERTEVVPWQPVGHVDVSGGDVQALPPGIVRLVPVDVPVAWDVAR